MTLDQLETRLVQVEMRTQVLANLVHAAVRGIHPTQRPLVLRQFQKYCQAMDAEAKRYPDSPEVVLQMRVLVEEYTKLEEVIRLIEEHERQHPPAA